MKISIQKKLMFIPYINLFLVFVWLYYYINKSNKDNSVFIKKILLGGLLALVINIPRIVLSFVIENNVVNSILLHLSAYASSIVICSIAIKDQEE